MLIKEKFFVAKWPVFQKDRLSLKNDVNEFKMWIKKDPKKVKNELLIFRLSPALPFVIGSVVTLLIVFL